MVLAGAGVDHEELVRLGEKYFGGLREGGAGAAGGGGSGRAAAGVADSVYSGGEARHVFPADKV